MGTKILRYQVRPGDTLRISRDVTLADRIGGSDWLTESGEDIDLDIHDIELVNRPEPPKPILRLGQQATIDHAEPPMGSKLACVYNDGGDSIVYTRLNGKQGDKWYPSAGNYGSTYAEQVGAKDHKHILIHLPSE